MSRYVPVELSFDVVEPKDGANDDLPPVVLHHGLSASKAYWSEITQNIADGTNRKVYIVDARNHGDSDWTDEFSFDLVAKDLEHFLDAHGMKKAILVGHSMGGMAAIRVALKRPKLVEKLVVEDMLASKLKPEAIVPVLAQMQTLRESLETIPVDADETLARQTIFKFVMDRMKSLHPEIPPPSPKISDLSSLIPMKKGPDGRYTMKANLKVFEKALMEYEAVYKEPEGTYDGEALFIYGTISTYDVLNDKGIPKHFPNATVYGVEGATHLVHNEKPEEFTAEVVRFILQ